ncbi:VCBS domain-containing protein [Hoeflea sp. WL0058]|uniref:VCBS domain-containing protein n=1 Tax=Flavimaribacter sediminis TaxID=2865987 RepID=A0AAE2ZTP4_9HYPH|nr:Ig-like domain-containing protein [Flavimaribacter sediminis]MBW8640680.1 VCBS domain-containing protein [Flavimaribacter sediminis]
MSESSRSTASQAAADWQALNDELELDPSVDQVLSVDAQAGVASGFTTVFEEDFSGRLNLFSLETVAESDMLGLLGTAFSNSLFDGTLLFEPVDVSAIDDGTIGFSIEADGFNSGRFAGSGTADADFLRVEVSIDGGEFQLLDLFQAASSGELQTFVGSDTGQVFDSETGRLSYVIPDGAESVQLRLTTELSKISHIIRIDDVEIGGLQQVANGYETGLLANDGDKGGAGLSIVSVEGIALFETTEVLFTALHEDFDHAGNFVVAPETVAQTDLLGLNGVAQANALFDGVLEFNSVDIADLNDETLSFSLNADLLWGSSFRNSAQNGSGVLVEVRLDDGSYQVIDEFELEGSGAQQVFVGSESGQQVAVGAGFANLAYDISDLAGNAETAQLRITAEVSGWREILEIDDVSLTGTKIIRTGEGIATTTLSSGALLTVSADGSFSYDANGMFGSLGKGEEAIDTFTYVAADASDNRDDAMATVRLAGANDAPVAVEDMDLAVEDGPVLNGSVADNDSDIDNDAVLTYALDVPVDGLNLDTDGSYAFDPAHETFQSLSEGAVIEVEAAYTVTDEHGASDQSTLTIHLTGRNDIPVAVEDTATVREDAPPIYRSVAYNDSDADDGAVLTYSLDEPVDGLSLNPDGSYAYDMPDAAFQFLAEGATIEIAAAYTVTDEHGASDQSTLTISVIGENDGPVAVSDTNSAVEDGPVVNGSVADNDSDSDDDADLIYILDEAVDGLTLDPDGSYVFDPTDKSIQFLAEGEEIEIVAAYTVSDEHGATDQSTLTIGVTGRNDAPVAVSDGNFGDPVTEAGPDDAGDDSAEGNVLTNDSDAEGDSLTVTQVNGSAGNVGQIIEGVYGVVTINADGSWTYKLDNADPNTEALGSDLVIPVDIFSYTVADTRGATSTTTLGISIIGVDDSASALSGPASFELAPTADLNTGDTITNSTFGSAVASGGDLNKDGFDGPVVGMTRYADPGTDDVTGDDIFVGGNCDDIFIFKNLDAQHDLFVDFRQGDDFVELKGFSLTLGDLDSCDGDVLNDDGSAFDDWSGGLLTADLGGSESRLPFQEVSSLFEGDLLFS